MRSLLFLLAVILGGIAHAAPSDSPAPIKIGFIGPLSGPWADWGDSHLKGFQLAVEDTRHKLQVVYADDRCEPKRSVTAATKMFAVDQVRLVIGPGCLMNVKAVAPIAQRHQALLFGTGGLDAAVVQHNSNVIDITSSVASESKYLAAYIADHTTLKTVAILHGTNAFGEELGSSLQHALRARGVTVTTKERSAITTNDYRAIVLKLVKSNPEAIFVHQGESATGTFVKQLRGVGYTGQIFGPYTSESDSVLTSGGAAALEGYRYTYNVNSAEHSPAKKRFEERYQARFRRSPTAHSLMVYDAVLQLDQTLTHCAPQATTCISNFFKSLGTVQGLSGVITYLTTGGSLRPFGIKRIHKGRFEWLVQDLEL